MATETQAAKAGAKAVADAVKKVADAAVAAAAAAPEGPSYDFDTTATPNGRFDISGQGFGTSGTVKFDGVQAELLNWSSMRIEGKVPPGIRGDIEVTVEQDEDTIQYGRVRI